MSELACYTGTVKSVNVRLADELHEQVVAQAQKDLRSLNSEIQWLLTFALETLEKRQRPPTKRP